MAQAGLVLAASMPLARLAKRYVADPRPTSLYFDSDGVAIHYTDVGAGAPVVLVHGFAVSGELNWRLPGVTRALQHRWRVINVDLRGHGRSGKPHGPDRYGAHMMRDIVRLLDHLELRDAHVAGYSLGGYLTLKLAIDSPHRVRSASLLGSGWEPPRNGALLRALPALADALEAGRGIGPIAGNLGDHRKKPGLGHQLWVKMMTRYFNDPQALIGVIRSVPQLAVSEEELRAVRVPLCTIVGSRDPLIESAQAMIGVAHDLTTAVIAGADHIRAPARPELHDALNRFLDHSQRIHGSG